VDSAKYEDMEAENIWRAHARIVYITYELRSCFSIQLSNF
jgi:hypothetical protein